jgi:aminoglycoside 2'-N-acetyltransferase I
MTVTDPSSHAHRRRVRANGRRRGGGSGRLYSVPDVRVLKTDAVPPADLLASRGLMDAAFGDRFSDDDWDHALGGTHVLAIERGKVLAHAAVVPRMLEVDGRPVWAGYVEAVATRPGRQGEGLGSLVMAEIAVVLRETYDLGALSTSRQAFYERLGWERWRGPTYVRAGDLVRTEDEDDGVMVLRFSPRAEVDLTSSITCESRAGDDW